MSKSNINYDDSDTIVVNPRLGIKNKPTKRLPMIKVIKSAETDTNGVIKDRSLSLGKTKMELNEAVKHKASIDMVNVQTPKKLKSSNSAPVTKGDDGIDSDDSDDIPLSQLIRKQSRQSELAKESAKPYERRMQVDKIQKHCNTDKIKAREVEILLLKEKLATKTNAYDQLEEKFNQLNTKTDVQDQNLTLQTLSSSQTMEALRGLINSREQELAGLAVRLTTAEETALTLRRQLTNSQQLLLQTDQTLASRNQQLDNMRQQLTYFQSRVNTVEHHLQDKMQQLSKSQCGTESLTKQLGIVQHKCTDLECQLDGMKKNESNVLMQYQKSVAFNKKQKAENEQLRSDEADTSKGE